VIIVGAGVDQHGVHFPQFVGIGGAGRGFTIAAVGKVVAGGQALAGSGIVADNIVRSQIVIEVV